MAKNQFDIELIDGYLRGELDAGQEEQFASRRNDPEFEELLHQMRSVFKHVQVAGRDDPRSTMRSLDRTGRTARTIRLRTVIGVAASILIIVVASFLVRPGTDLDQLATHYLEPYPNVIAPIQKRGSEDEPDRYQEAFQLYEMGYYNKAQDIFQTLDQEDEAVQFYSAMTYILSEKYEDGIDRLEKIYSDPGHRFHAAAQWYASLGFLVENRKNEGVLLLNELASGSTPFATRAQQVVDELK